MDRGTLPCQILSKFVNTHGDFSVFIRWWPSAILDLFVANMKHPQWVLGGRYHSAKFGYDQCSSFYNMNISIFDASGWKRSIHIAKIRVLGQSDPLNGLQYEPKPKSTPLHESASFESSSVKMRWAVWLAAKLLKKATNKICGYISPICPATPMDGFPPNFAQL